MAETPINEMLKQLRSREPQQAWALFLQDYGSLILQIVRRFEQNADHVSDCFQFVCEQISKGRFRRLRKFKAAGSAKFATWLRAVVRNLCLDWHRKQFGRRRIFRSISLLSDLDQEIFRELYERGATERDVLVSLTPRFPHLTADLVSEAIERINKELTKNQRWLLGARSALAPRLHRPELEDTDRATEIADPRPNPETQAIMEEKRTIVNRALGRLPTRERLLMRLRFEEELTLEQIATLLDLGNAQRVDRHIKEVLSRLRNDMDVVGSAILAEKIRPSP